ncbi:MAG: Eco57I restriction-modification methylase domain-containing protein, partial [Planctomycetota bacterium]
MLKNYNPDVLTCLANLSSDEVFTPPQLANQILDLLPQEIWRDKNATFLDPVCKSGIFLREIAKRLDEGLENIIPDKQKRVNHIYKNQLFGIAITELTSLLSRRSLYCSKTANGKYSVCETFDNKQGNIIFERIEHSWENGRCVFCGASRNIYDRGEQLETHAYKFIHTNNPEEIFNMKFDVIIGNPPYQLIDGGAQASAIPLYHKFVKQAKKLNPRFLTMIIPSRWFAGGRGLDAFRNEMLKDHRIRTIHDFLNASDCFPCISLEGGACYFLWDRDNKGLCKICTHEGNKITSELERPLLEINCNIFIRYNEAIEILHKVTSKNEESIIKEVSSQKPFGFRTYFTGKEKYFKDSIKVYANKKIGYVKKSEVMQNQNWIDLYKVYVSMAYGMGNTKPYQVINKPILGEPESCCTETYMVIGPYSSEKRAKNVISYLQTKFFRFLVLLRKNTQHAAKAVYTFVPIQDFNETWTDEKLYKKYRLTKD